MNQQLTREYRPDKALYLQPSPHKEDAGQLIGCDPRDLPVELLRQLGAPTSPSKAARAMCLGCCGNQPSEVRKCVAVKCPLWSYRMGMSPFHARRSIPENTPAHLAGFQPADGLSEGTEA